MVNLGEETIRAPFSLAAEEEADNMAVASTSVALSGLTITPSVPPEAASGDWTYGGMGGGRFSPFAASARATRSRGGGSIASALTEAPSLASFSPFTGGGVGGGFGGGGGTGSAGAAWRPSTDRHACGESRRIPLICVRNDREEFCLGCIGDDEYRFCRSTACNIVKHKKRPYDLGCQEGYYIPTGIAKASRGTQAFRTPFLDASKLTPEVRLVVTSTREQGLKTTIEWEGFIMQAQLAWHAALDAARSKQGAGISEGSNEDDSSSDSMVSLLDEPGRYKFADSPIFGNIDFGETEGAEPTVLEIGAAIAELDQKMQAAMETIREDQVGIMNHLWGSLQRLSSAARSVQGRMQGLEDGVGDTEAVLEEHNLGDLSEGLMMALGRSDASEILLIQDRMAALTELIRAVDEDHKQAARFLLGKVNSLLPPTAQGIGASTLGTSLPLEMMIVNAQGDSVGTLEQILQGLRGLVDDNARLRREVDSLTVGVTTQGMNILDGLGFASEAQVRELVELECPGGDAFEVFLDVVSLWCCDPGYAPATNWEKTTRAMEEDYSTTARKVVASYYQTHCWWYAEGKPAVAGTTLAAFKNTDKWEGMSGMDGRRREIETSAGISAEIGKTWVADKLPPTGKLAPLAIKMIDKTVEWISKVHKHLDAELLKLTQQHITAEDALILLSEEVIIMFSRIQTERMQRMEFVASRANKVDYMTRCIWITLQVHRVMQEFVQGGLHNNSTIATAFMRFLVKTSAGNAAGGGGGQLKTLTDKVDKLQTAVALATTTSKDALKDSKEALTRASTANTQADNARNAVNSLYAKNSTLKR